MVVESDLANKEVGTFAVLSLSCLKLDSWLMVLLSLKMFLLIDGLLAMISIVVSSLAAGAIGL